VICWFPNFAFFKCNLYRYPARDVPSVGAGGFRRLPNLVGLLYKLNAVDS
jgi:hypothetical protein